jgi:hypothetical protein
MYLASYIKPTCKATGTKLAANKEAESKLPKLHHDLQLGYEYARRLHN